MMALWHLLPPMQGSALTGAMLLYGVIRSLTYRPGARPGVQEPTRRLPARLDFGNGTLGKRAEGVLISAREDFNDLRDTLRTADRSSFPFDTDGLVDEAERVLNSIESRAMEIAPLLRRADRRRDDTETAEAANAALASLDQRSGALHKAVTAALSFVASEDVERDSRALVDMADSLKRVAQAHREMDSVL